MAHSNWNRRQFNIGSATMPSHNRCFGLTPVEGQNCGGGRKTAAACGVSASNLQETFPGEHAVLTIVVDQACSPWKRQALWEFTIKGGSP